MEPEPSQAMPVLERLCERPTWQGWIDRNEKRLLEIDCFCWLVDDRCRRIMPSKSM